jgi:hypothetical protein
MEKVRLRGFATAGLLKIFNAKKQRRNWVRIRNAQLEELETLKLALLKAYDVGSEERINFILSEVDKLEAAGCKETPSGGNNHKPHKPYTDSKSYF